MGMFGIICLRWGYDIGRKGHWGKCRYRVNVLDLIIRKYTLNEGGAIGRGCLTYWAP